MIQRRVPETRDRRDYAISDAEIQSVEPFVPPPEVECVWCGLIVIGEAWLMHQLDAHYDECYANWIRGLAILRQRDRYVALRRAAKARYGGMQVRV